MAFGKNKKRTPEDELRLAKKLLEEERKKARQNTEEKEEREGMETSLAQRLVEKRKEGGNAPKEKKKEEINTDSELLENLLPRTMCADFIPIRSISNKGVIYTEEGKYIKIVEVMPINFLLKNETEQMVVLNDFEKYIRIAPGRFQIKSLSKRTDISRYLKRIDEEIEKETDERCKRLQEDYKNLIRNVGASGAVSRRFFLILEMDQKDARQLSDTEIDLRMEAMASTAKRYLKDCGNQVIEMDDPYEDTAKILFDILNREKAASTDFVTRLRNVYSYYKYTYGDEGLENIPITEFFAPSKIDLMHSDYTKIDNTYYTFLFMTSAGFPSQVFGGWTSILINAGEGVDVDIFVEKQNRARMLTNVGRRLRWNATRMKNVNSSTTEYDTLNDTMASGDYLKTGMSVNNQDFYYAAILITLSAPSLKELDALKREMLQGLRAIELYANECRFLQEEAFKSYLPLSSMDKSFWKRSRRNVLTHDLSSFYPFTSYEMSDEDGVLLGVNETNNSLCIADFFDTETYKNANISIVGTSGAGKTYLIQLLAMRFRRKQIQTFIIAPDKGHEFKRACENIGGQFITISPASSQCINVMEIRKRDTSASELLEGAQETDYSELANKIQSLHIFFDLLIPDMNAEEDQLLDEALIEAYFQKGITHDNKTLEDPHNPGHYKEMPILEDVYNILIKNDASRRVANIMNRLVHGSARSFNQQTNVDLDNLYTVIDISSLTGNLLTVGMYVALDLVYSKAKENRTIRKEIIIDEVWELIGSKSNTKAAEYVLEIFKIIRGYGGGAICATQDLNDFFALEDGKYGKGIINNSKTKIVLNLEIKEAQQIKDLLTLSEEEYQKIIGFQRGHGLLSTNNNNIPIHFQSSPLENELITTDRRQLAELVKKRQGEN